MEDEVKEEKIASTDDNATTDVATVNEGELDIAGIQKMAGEMSVSSEDLVSNYLEFTPGEEGVVLLPLSIKRIPTLKPSKEDWDNKREDEDKPHTDAIRVLNVDDGIFYITAAAVLVSELKTFIPDNNDEAKRMFFIRCLGTKQSKTKGEYQTFSIKPMI